MNKNLVICSIILFLAITAKASDRVEEIWENNSISPHSPKLLHEYPLDSTVGFFFTTIHDSVREFKSTFLYDVEGVSQVEIRSNWDDNSNSWVDESKYLYGVDKMGNDTMYASYNWDVNSNSWIGSFKMVWTYSPEGWLISQKNQNWNNDSLDWLTNLNIEIVNNEDGNIVEAITYKWNPVYKELTLYEKEAHTYNADKMEISFTMSSWNYDTEEWEINDSIARYYDNNLNDTLTIEYTWDNTLISLEKSVRIEKDYDQAGNKTVELYQTWNSILDEFKNKSKTEFIYDDNLETHEYNYNWDKINEEWQNGSLISHFYDNNGNTTNIVNKVWSDELGDWENVEQEIRTYYESLILSWTFNNWYGSWIPNLKYYSYFNGLGELALSERKFGNLQLYPIPATNTLHYSNTTQLKTVNIYSLSGNLLRTYNGTMLDGSINIQNFESGIYLFELVEKNNRRSIQKVLIK